MDYNNEVVLNAEKIEIVTEENRVTPLADFQLALVGGGSGEVILQ